MQFSDFLQNIFPNYQAIAKANPSFEVVLWVKQGKHTQAFALGAVESANSWIADEVARGRDVYFTVSLQDRVLLKKAKKQRAVDCAVAIPGVWADVDCLDDSGAHAKTNLPTKADALALLEELSLRPTLIVDTGHGFHAYWLFDNPWVFQSAAERKEAARLVKDFQATLRSRMVEKGWTVDSTQDLARVLRIPGTKNFKKTPALDVTQLQGKTKERYSKEAVAGFAKAGAAIADVERDDASVKPGEGTPASFASARSDGVLRLCSFLAYAKRNAKSLPEPEWHAQVSVLAWAEDGPDVIHELSAVYPGYVREETDAKIRNVLKADGPMTCDKIDALMSGRHCSLCPYRRQISTPLELGGRRWRDAKKEFLHTNDLDAELKAVDEALSECADVFQSGGLLVRMWKNPMAARPGGGHVPLEIQDLRAPALKAVLTGVRQFFRPTEHGPKLAYPSDTLIQAALEARACPSLRHLRGITPVPVMRQDGTILQEAGYDAATEMFLDPCNEFPRIPDQPTADGCKAASERLLEVVEDFPFAAEHGKAVFLAAILTVVGRSAFLGPVPMILVDANVPGSGKTKLADAIGLITTGQPLPRVTQTQSEEEERKRITSILRKGHRLLLIDNVGARLGGPVLDALLTSDVWQDRVLGKSRVITLPNNLMVIATGNNLGLQADTVRRCLRIQLTSGDEHPEARSDFHHKDLEKWILDNQPRLLASALTLLRGYVDAGRPPQEMVTLGSFSGWSCLIQATVKWALGIDPGEARPSIGEGQDLNMETLGLLMEGWREIAPHGEPLACRDVMKRIEQRTLGSSILDAMELAAPGKKPTAVGLGHLVRKFRKRMLDYAYFDQVGEKTAAGRLWKLLEGNAGGTEPR